MKILLLHNYYRFRGGEETYFESLSNLLVKKGHQVYQYIKNSSDIENRRLSKMSVAKGLFWNNNIYDEISGIITKFKPDIAHFNNIYPLITPTAYKVCNDLKIPIIQTIHNYRLLCPKGTLFRNNSICELCVKKRFKYPSIIYKCYQHSHLASTVLSTSFLFHINTFHSINHFIFPSEFTLKYHVENLPYLKEKSSYLPLFTNPSKEQKIGSKYFLYIGRFNEEKGIEELLAIFSTLPNIKLKAVGEGPLKHKLKLKYSKYLNIIFHDQASSDELKKILKNAKCLIIPSKWYEVLPYVYLEAMSMGVPVLTPKTETFKRTIETNELFYYQFNKFENLKNKIISLEKVIKNTKYKFFEEYLAHYTAKFHYDKLLNIYHQVK